MAKNREELTNEILWQDDTVDEYEQLADTMNRWVDKRLASLSKLFSARKRRAHPKPIPEKRSHLRT